MKKLLAVLVVASLALLNIGWVSETGGGVVSDNSSVVVTSLEATQVLQSDVLAKLQGETQLGGAVNYASFNSAGALDFRNVSTPKKIILNRNDSISWDSLTIISDDGLVIQDLTRSNGYKFTALRTGNVDVNSISVNTITASNAYLTSWSAPNNFIVVGNVTADSVSCSNATISNSTVWSANTTQSRIAHVIATDGTINYVTVLNITADGVSADNITALGATLTNVDMTNVDMTKLKLTGGISADNVTSTGGTFTSLDSTGIVRADHVSTTTGAVFGNTSTDAVTIFGVTSMNSTLAVIGELTLKDTNTGTNAGTALAIDANGKVCITGQCA